jgi:hypothetical protein
MRFLMIIIIFFCFQKNIYSAEFSDIQQLRHSIHLGDIRFEVTTNNATAKEHFLLGVTFLHAFMYDLAIQQFQQAQKIDPGFAMSYWGEAMAYKHSIWNYENIPSAKQTLKRYYEKKDARALSKKEQSYLNAVEILFSDQTLLERDSSYLVAMQKLHENYPNDPNVAAFYALSLMGIASDFPENKSIQLYMENGRKLIQEFYNQFPNNPGILHYYMHYHDTADLSYAKEALPAAKMSLKMMSSSSHVTHMAAHIYRRLELWDDYILANIISIKASDNICKLMNNRPFYACDAENKYHSFEWLQEGYLRNHQYKKSNELVNQIAVVATEDSNVIYKQWYYRMWARQVLATQNWHIKIIKIEPITKIDDQLYWSAYSECGGLLASSFLAIHNKKPIDIQLNRLNNIIQYADTLSDPYIKHSCQIAKLEVQAEAAHFSKSKIMTENYVKEAMTVQKHQISTELTPSLSFVTAQQYSIDFIHSKRIND